MGVQGEVERADNLTRKAVEVHQLAGKAFDKTTVHTYNALLAVFCRHAGPPQPPHPPHPPARWSHSHNPHPCSPSSVRALTLLALRQSRSSEP